MRVHFVSGASKFLAVHAEYNQFRMSQEIEAIYENGVFRPLQSVSLQESQMVKIIVSTSSPAEAGRDWDLLDRARAEVSRIPDIPSIEKVRELLARIPGSLSRDVIAERGEY